jgi:hypothetical protein
MMILAIGCDDKFGINYGESNISINNNYAFEELLGRAMIVSCRIAAKLLLMNLNRCCETELLNCSDGYVGYYHQWR